MGCHSGCIGCPLVVLGALKLLLGDVRFMFGYGNDALCSVLPIGCNLVFIG